MNSCASQRARAHPLRRPVARGDALDVLLGVYGVHEQVGRALGLLQQRWVRRRVVIGAAGDVLLCGRLLLLLDASALRVGRQAARKGARGPEAALHSGRGGSGVVGTWDAFKACSHLSRSDCRVVAAATSSSGHGKCRKTCCGVLSALRCLARIG